MYAVLGVSGNTGGATARVLIERGRPTRVVVRDPAKGKDWERRGAEVAVADLADPDALATAFAGADAAYVLNPPAYTEPDLFAHAEELARSIAAASRRTRLRRLVVLSSIGAQHERGTGNILTNHTFERVLGTLETPVTFLRPAYFMENWAWVAPVAANDGLLPAFLAPPDRAIAMVAAADIGWVAADALEDGSGERRLIELAGPREHSPADVAAAFSRALGRPIAAVSVPEADWPATLAGSGFSPGTIAAWVELFHAINRGLVAFEREPVVRGRTALDQAVAAIVHGR